MIVITGGEGFIGQALQTELKLLGRPFETLDIAESADRRVDLLDPVDTLNGIDGADTVVHLAGPVLDGVKRDPAAAIALQVQGTINVMEAARRSGVRKVVLASSFYVYSGQPAEAVVNELTPLDVEKMDPFGAAKLMSERIVRHWGQKYGIEWAALRFGSVYGWGRCSNVVQDMIQHGLNGERFGVWGSGARRNQYTFVDDVARACAQAVTVGWDDVVNVISPEVTTIRQLADLMLELEVVETEFDLERPDPASMCYMASYRAEANGWLPTPLGAGLRETVRRARAEQHPTAHRSLTSVSNG